MPRNLLVVDDSSTIRDAVRYSLAGEDWIVAAVADTAEALETIRGGAVDAVLCDASLTPDDGYEACRMLRSAMGDDPVPIVLMGSKVSENLAASAGATAVLTKPFESQELLEVLRAGMEQGSFDVASDDFAPLDEEELALEPADPAAAAAPSIAEEEVEIIDLSGDEEAEDLELLQDLQPLPLAPASAASGPEPSSREWELEGLLRPLDLGEVAVPEEPDTGLRHGGAVEFDLDDLGGEGDEEVPSVGELDFAPRPAGEAESLARAGEVELQELDLDDLDLDMDLEPVVPAASAPGRAEAAPTPQPSADFERGAGTDDLLGDIDLEGWAEESASPTGEAPAPAAPREAEPSSWTLPLGPEDESEQAPPPAVEPQEELALETAEPEAEAPVRGWVEAEVPAEGDESPEDSEFEEEGFGILETEAPATEPEAEKGYVAAEGAPAESPAELPEAYESWPEPVPAPSVEAPWDQQAPQAESAEVLAEPVARAAEEAVRHALAKSLSPQALTPVVAAVVERVVWEVVPQLAERLIREAIERLQQDPDDG